MRFFNTIIIFFICAAINICAEESKNTSSTEIKEECAVTSHNLFVDGQSIPYKAHAGTLILKDTFGKPKANVFYVAYVKDDVKDLSKRPITFCFNGGPGSSSVWLHLGLLGPKRIVLDTDGCAQRPYTLVNNEHSLLKDSDLVFIDPVSTGYSRPVTGEDAKQFHGVEEDIQWVSEFIRLYTTRNQRWTSPKFLAGESYGTVRATGLLGHLHDEHHMPLSGIILISSVLNFQTMPSGDFASGNDLPYVLTLPTYTAAAWYHKRLPADLQKKPLEQLLEEVEAFSSNDYTLALVKGDNLQEKERAHITRQLSRYTGLSPAYIAMSNIRVMPSRFTKELLRDEHRTVGRFDCRVKGIDQDCCRTTTEYDPSLHTIAGGFSSAFQHYIRSELNWEKDDTYNILVDVSPWNYGEHLQNRYLNISHVIPETLAKNPKLRIFVASGYYDLGTPYFATDYTFNHLGLDAILRKNISVNYYEGGHMMYTLLPQLQALGKDLSQFINHSCREEL